MTTQYTPILKLALPVTGELSGTWGDVVNDNITSMVEQAVAGLATINTWTANSHALTTANGTTSESRCAMLVAADGAGGTALTAAGEIICPAASKLYVLKNGSSYAVTLKTSGGSGVAVPSGDTAFLFCDGTNVNACVTTIVNGHISGNLTVDGNTTLGNAATDTITATAQFNTDLLPSTDNARDLGSTAKSWRTLYCDTSVLTPLVTATNLQVTNIKANDGTAAMSIADSTGAITVSTLLNVDNLRLDGNTLSSTDSNGNIVLAPNGNGDVQLDADTVRVGDSNANATLTTNGTGDLILNTNAGTNSGSITIQDGIDGNIIIAPNGNGQVQISNAALDLTTIEVTNIKAKDGTAAMSIADSTGAVTVSTLLNVDNLRLDGNTISSTDSNGNITLAPNGTGDVYVEADTLQLGDSNTNATLTTNGTGDLILNTNAGTNSGSITIQDGVDGNIIIAPNGNGQVQITNAALDLTTIEVTNIKAKDGTASIVLTDSTGAVDMSQAVTMSATTQNIALGTSQTSGTFTVGGTAQTGTQTFDQSTKTHTLNVGTGATESGLTKTVNIATGGVATSTTAITIGSTNGTTTTLNGTVTAATLNSTTIDTTNIEVTNIKAKDGTAAIVLTDSTGAVGISTAVTMSATTQNISLGASQTTGTFAAGGAAQTGTLTFDPSTKTHTLNIGTGATESAATKTINLGTAGVATSTTAINIGSTNGTTITLNGTVNATTLDLTNLEVTNIKAKDGTASITLADTTGIITLSATAGTANGVAYLNGSRALTTGSALTFDGTNLFVGTSTNTNSSRIVSAGTISETVSSVQYLVASQYDVGTAANQLPLNQYLGNLAYQDAGAIAGPVGLGGVVTLYAGTANGVAYLDASKVLTTGSALTFNGTTFNAPAITENSSPAVVQSDLGTSPNEVPLNQYLGAMAFEDTETPALDVGTGITTGTGTICKANGGLMGGIFQMSILIDLTGLNSGGTAGDIIGVNGTALPCYIALIPAMTVLGGRMTCLETPAGGDTDIDLYSAAEGTGVEDQAISALTETEIINAGAQTRGTVTYFSADPAANTYFYLVGQGTANATYTAGRFLIEIFGVQ